MVRIASFVIPTLLAVTLASVSDLGAQSRSAPDRPRPLPELVTPPANFRAALKAGTRSPTGAPGPNYWQQWASYDLYARLEPAGKRLEGTALITYYNRSPDTLRVLALHLLQNLHVEGAMRNEPAEVTGGVELHRVAVAGEELPEATRPGRSARYEVSGTILLVAPPKPVLPRDSVRLEMEWAFTVPQAGAGERMGWSRDNLFHIAYWYPQMAVYDDVVGWQVDQFLSNAEFYMGFGSYSVSVEVPQGWVVMATGDLMNPEEVLPERILDRYRRAHESDNVVHVLTAQDFGPGKATRRSESGYLTWRFQADSVRDAAFSATWESKWDAARTPAGDRDGDGRTDYVLVNAFYRASAPRWERTWRYAQHAIDFLSRWTGYSYPWPHMTAVEGEGIILGGMEFPMMTLMADYNQRGDSALYYVTAHELAHMWVPMIVGSDEKRYSWMDEGTTTFNENQARKEFFPRINPDELERRSFLNVSRAGLEGEIMRRSDYHYTLRPAFITASYRKPASLLAALRDLLGEETFVPAYRTYIRNWAFKHPKPWDFFNTFNTASGRSLDWFWHSWYYETWTLDQAVATVTVAAGETTIVIDDRGLVPMPARLTITLANGDMLFREVPVDTWLSGKRSAEVVVQTESPVVRVEIDAEGVFPDINRANNVWTRD